MKFYLSLIVLVGLLAGGAAEYFMIAKKSQEQVSKNLLITCVDKVEGMPVITSVTPISGSVGAKIEIKGCNLAGFEGDKSILVENYKGEKGILYGERDGDSKSIKVILVSPLCQSDNSYSGKPCEAKLDLAAGQYKIYTLPWGKKSNEASFIVY